MGSRTAGPSNASRPRSCAPRGGQYEIRIGFPRLKPVIFADRAAAEQTVFDLPCDGGELLTRAPGNRGRGGKLAAGACGLDQSRTTIGDVLDRAEQQVVDGLGEESLA